MEDEDKVSKCIDLITEEIKNQESKKNDFDVTGLTQDGIVQGLKIARLILTQYWEEIC